MHAWKLEPHVNHIVMWLRFIDDMFLIGDGTDVEFEDNFEILKKNDICLDFTYEISDKEIVFLDTRIYIAEGIIQTTLHRKETATNAILHAESHHPENLVWSIPYGEFLRIKRNCSEENEFKRHSNETRERLVKRKYPGKILDKCYSRALTKSRNDALQRAERKTENEKIRLITDYNVEARNLKKILLKNWNILKLDPTLKDIIGSEPSITYRKT